MFKYAMNRDRGDDAAHSASAAGAGDVGAPVPGPQAIAASFAAAGIELAAARAESLARGLRRLVPHASLSISPAASNAVAVAAAVVQPSLDPQEADARDAAFDQQFDAELRRFAEAASRFVR
jgi:hypothetical protein